MIRHLRHDEIDKAAWDAGLEHSAAPWWYGRSWVLDAACPGWEALVDEVSGARMALPWRSRFGIRYLYQPFLLQRIGVFGGDAAPFLAAIPKAFRYADIYLNAGEVYGTDPHVRLSEQQNFELDLRSPIELLRAGYSVNLRRNLRRPGAEVLRLEEGADVERVLAFLEGSEQFKRWGIDPVRIACMERLMRGAMAHGEGRPYLMWSGGSVLAAAFLVEWSGRLIFLKGLASAAGREARAMHHLLDRVIARHAGRPLVLDLAGSNDADLARFYSGFGAQRTVYLRAVINRLPPLVRNLKS